MSNLATDQLGRVEHLSDGRAYVVFEREYAHPVERVWAALTDPAELAQWFPGFTVELRVGGHYEIRFGNDCEGPPHVSGTVSKCDPPNCLQCGSIRWELTATQTGCRLVFSDILWFEGPRTNTDICNSVLGGWHHYLDLLASLLRGEPIKPDRPEVDYAAYDIPGRE